MYSLHARLAIAATLVSVMLPGNRVLDETASDPYDYQNEDDEGVLVAYTKLGDVYVAGTGTSHPQQTNSGTDFIVVKYDASLNRQWHRSYNGPGNGNDGATGIAVDDEGNVYVCGPSEGSGTGFDIAVKGWKPNVDDVWTGSGFHDGAARYDSGVNDYATDMAIDKAGNLAISGYKQQTGPTTGLAIVFTSAGAVKSGWPVTKSPNGLNGYVFTDVAVADNFQVAVAGQYAENTTNQDMYVARYSGGGSVIHEWTLDYEGNEDDARDVTFGSLVNNIPRILVTGKVVPDSTPPGVQARGVCARSGR